MLEILVCKIVRGDKLKLRCKKISYDSIKWDINKETFLHEYGRLALSMNQGKNVM